MKTIPYCNILGCDAKSLVDQLSSFFEAEYEADNNEYCFDIPESQGSGYIKGLEFSHGVHVLVIDVILIDDLTIEFKKNGVNPLRLLFNQHATLDYSNTVEGVSTIAKLQRVLFSNGVSSRHSITLKNQKHHSFFLININRKAFEEKIDAFADDIYEDLELIFKDLNGVNHVYNIDNFSLEISELIEEFKNCELDEFMKPVFLEGKAYEILTLQMQELSDHLKGKNKDILLRKSTVDKVEKAVDIIKNELDVRINVHKLAKRVGLNQNTLQSGFKTLFKTSVNEYIKDYRLDLAKKLLQESDLNITEITYKVGINSRSYFSKLFKERYGISPKDYVAQIKKTKSA